MILLDWLVDFLNDLFVSGATGKEPGMFRISLHKGPPGMMGAYNEVEANSYRPVVCYSFFPTNPRDILFPLARENWGLVTYFCISYNGGYWTSKLDIPREITRNSRVIFRRGEIALQEAE